MKIEPYTVPEQDADLLQCGVNLGIRDGHQPWRPNDRKLQRQLELDRSRAAQNAITVVGRRVQWRWPDGSVSG